MIDAIFTTHQTLDDVFMSTGYYGTADIRFGSSRTLDSDVHMDPHAKSAGADPYYRSVVGRLAVTTDQVLGGPAPAPDPDRWAGSDRYGTAQAIDDKSFPDGPTPVVFVASGAAFPDALAGAAAAAKQHAPLVITSPDSLPVVDQGRAGPPEAAADRHPGRAGQHLGGRRAAARRHGRGSGQRRPPHRGQRPLRDRRGHRHHLLHRPRPRALHRRRPQLPRRPRRGRRGGPLRGAHPARRSDRLPDATLQAIKTLAPQAIKVLGGTASVSDAVKDALGAAAKVTPTRLAGADRYATAVAISQDTYPGNPSVDTLYVASGANFPDALVGAALGKPLVLAQGRTVASSVLAEVTRLDPGRIVFLGGPGSISYTVVLAIRGAAPSAT